MVATTLGALDFRWGVKVPKHERTDIKTMNVSFATFRITEATY